MTSGPNAAPTYPKAVTGSSTQQTNVMTPDYGCSSAGLEEQEVMASVGSCCSFVLYLVFQLSLWLF